MQQTADNITQIVKVLVLNYDPIVPTEGNKPLHTVFNWTAPRQLAAGYEGSMEYASGGAIDFQVVQWRDLNEFPAAVDGFRYSPAEWVQDWRANSGWHNAATDFYRLAEEQGLAALVNSGAIDEVWMFGPPKFDVFGESWMFGPHSFFINGPSFPAIGIDRAIAGYGFNYERGVAEMIHDNGHRTENHMVRSFGGTWNGTNPQTAWEKFSSLAKNTPNHVGGVGNTHFPVNGLSDYDYGNSVVVSSTADDWLNYPNLTGAVTQVDRSAWSAGSNPDYQRDYLEWFFGHLPRNSGTTPDGRQNNWYKYIYDFNSYEPTTGLPRHEFAIAGAAPVTKAGGNTYTFSVRYYDQTGIDTTTLDNSDIMVTGPGGFSQLATRVNVGAEAKTTAGTARTVTYAITPLGGSWDLLDDGTYTISMRANQVRDTIGNYVAASSLNTFQVQIADPRAIDVNALVAAGSAVVTGTAPDIGTFANLFDNNVASLYRTPAVNPATVQIAFTTPQTFYGFKALFTAAFGNPAYRWSVETADSQSDLDSHTGSWRQAVGITNTPSDQFSTVNLPAPITTTYVKLTATRLTGDNYVHIVEWSLLGSSIADSQSPIAALQSAFSITSPGSGAEFISVAYTDNSAIDVATLRTGNIQVTGPNGFDQPATFYSVDDYTNGPSRTATYYILPPGGAWDYTDDGTYTITLRPGQIGDRFGNKNVSSLVLGSFNVSIGAPARRPPIDMTELNADQWSAWAQSATASTSDDSTLKISGQSSVKFVTDGGFDTYLRYPPAGSADWDISSATQLSFSVYAQDPSPFGFQANSPMIRITDLSGSYYEYHDYKNGSEYPLLNDARGVWKTYSVPLNAGSNTANGWRRSASGTPDLTHMASIEFHADTWDSGFILWYDKVGFNLTTPTGDVALHGTAGPDSYFIQANGNNVEIFENIPVTGSPTYRIPSSQLTSLTINGGSGDDSVTFLTALPITPQFKGSIGNSTLNIDAGNFAFNTDSGASQNLTVNVNAGSALFNASQHLSALTIAANASVSLSPGGGKILVVNDLQIAGSPEQPNGTLDLANNDIIVRSLPARRDDDLAYIIALVQSGRSSGDWNGEGIASTTAAAEPNKLTGLAVALNDKGNGSTLYSTFDGEPVDVNSILVKYSYNGDADFNGKIDADDYFQIDNGFAQNLAGYRNGDFDLNGTVDADDYFLIDRAFVGQTGMLATHLPAASAGSSLSKIATHRRAKHHRSANR